MTGLRMVAASRLLRSAAGWLGWVAEAVFFPAYGTLLCVTGFVGHIHPKPEEIALLVFAGFIWLDDRAKRRAGGAR